MTGDGVYLRAGEYLFLFTCDESSCQWTTVKEGLENFSSGVMMPLPSDYTCELSIGTYIIEYCIRQVRTVTIPI